MVVYSLPSGPKARLPPLWLPYGSGTESSVVRVEGIATVPLERKRATTFRPVADVYAT